MYLPTLYKRATTGAIQQWTIEVDGDKYRTIAGQRGGQLTTTEWTDCEGKNVGRSNETTPAEQSLAEAKAKWKKKSEKGYVENIQKVDDSGFMQVMLAQNYEDRVEEIDFTNDGAVVSPKLDGIRCVVDNKGMWSREGKSLLAGSPHIFRALKPFLDSYPQLTDGELYNHQFKDNFNKIVSLIKKQKPTPEELEESERLVQYWIFDCVEDNLSWFVRFINNSELRKYITKHPCIKMVINHSVASPKDVDDAFKKYRREGFEGAMVRWGIHNIGYDHKRSKYLLKYKDFVTDEFEIVDVLTGRGNKADKAAKIKCRDKRGVTFEANIEGDWDFCTQLLADKSQVIGKQGTVRYQNLTPDEQVPRIGYLIAIRDYE